MESNNIVAYLGKAAERVITNNFTGDGSDGDTVQVDWFQGPARDAVTFHVNLPAIPNGTTLSFKHSMTEAEPDPYLAPSSP